MRADWLRADESFEEMRSREGCCKRSWLTESFEPCPIGSVACCNRKSWWDRNVLEAATFTAPQADIPHAQPVLLELRNVLRYAQLVPRRRAEQMALETRSVVSKTVPRHSLELIDACGNSISVNSIAR
jgi:hypothetical protein